MVSKQLRVTVTAEDVDKGVNDSSTLCQIALALLREGHVRPVVGGSYVVSGHAYCAYYYAHSKASERFMHRFDAGMPVSPATFVLREA